jgi:hypothetical protein
MKRKYGARSDGSINPTSSGAEANTRPGKDRIESLIAGQAKVISLSNAGVVRWRIVFKQKRWHA